MVDPVESKVENGRYKMVDFCGGNIDIYYQALFMLRDVKLCDE